MGQHLQVTKASKAAALAAQKAGKNAEMQSVRISDRITESPPQDPQPSQSLSFTAALKVLKM